MAFHLWDIKEIYSNADGTVQFIELFTTASTEHLVAGHTITFTPTGGSAVIYTVPTNTATGTANKSLLFATAAFDALPGSPTPDYIIPDGFLSAAGGTLNVFGVDILTFGAGVLPTDGTNSLNDTNPSGVPNLVSAVNSPTNFVGVTGSITAPGGSLITGTAGPDSLVGGTSDDTIDGGAGDDILDGAGGADSLVGGTGNDHLVGGAGNDILNGGADSDTANYSASGALVTASLLTNTATGTSTGSDTLSLIENLTGSGFADTLTGDAQGNVLSGLAGSDTINGGDGEDTLDGGADADSLVGGANQDMLTGGAGADSMQGGTDHDLFLISAVADFAVGEVIDGGVGDFDILSYTGTTAASLVLTGLVTNLEHVQIADAEGATTGTAAINLDASAVNNALNIVGNDGANALTGTQYPDLLLGNGGDDSLSGGSNGDGLNGGAGNDMLDGGEGADSLVGGAGNDILTGGTDADTLEGGSGIDSLAGGGGNDTHIVTATASAGESRIVFTPDAVVENGGEGTADTVYSSSSYTLSGEVENLVLNGAAIWRPYTGTGNELGNAITGAGAVRQNLFGVGGNDTLDGGAGADRLDGGSGDDVLLYDSADAGVNGGADTDALRLSGEDDLNLAGLAGTVIQNVETIDLVAGSGANGLTLALADVLAISSTTETLKVDGDSGDTVTATDAGSWSFGGNDGTYDTWTQGAATLLVDQDINTNFVA